MDSRVTANTNAGGVAHVRFFYYFLNEFFIYFWYFWEVRAIFENLSKYKKNQKNLKILNIQEISRNDVNFIAKKYQKIQEKKVIKK